MIEKHGFISNPRLPFWLQCVIALRNMPLEQLFKLSTKNNRGFHNLCTTLVPPPGIEKLLQYGLNFCLESALPEPHLDETLERLTYDIRVRHFVKEKMEDGNNDDYDPKLYIKSQSFVPDDAPPQIEQGIRDFKSKLAQLIKDNKQTRHHNLPPDIRQIIKELEANNEFISMNTDKNLGPAIMERQAYLLRCLQEHLLKGDTYKQLSKAEAINKLSEAETLMKKLISLHESNLTDSELRYFKRCFELDTRIPQFYAPPKVHKLTLKSRPVVSCVNSRLNYLSKWIDRHLQKVLHLCPGYLKDSQALIQKLLPIGDIPTTTTIVISDAVSMYTYIDTKHAMEILEKWFELHKNQLPHRFPTEMVLEATKIVMNNNIFQFDDTYWHQQTGTAMGTSCACPYATIYYSYHEITSLLPRFLRGYQPPPRMLAATVEEPAIQPLPKPMLTYGRLIDDTLHIWDMASVPSYIKPNFKEYIENAMAFGKLKWEIEQDPARQVNFLDLTITLENDGTYSIKTYVKAMNLHLYIPPESAHPKGILKSLVFGNLSRYWRQNTQQSTFISTTRDFYGHLKNRGYTDEVLLPIFTEAAKCIDDKAMRLRENSGSTPTPTQSSGNDRLFLHWTYHPRDISRKAIRQAFDETLAPAVTPPPLGVKQFTLAYSNPRNLRRCLTKTQLDEPQGHRVSDILEQLKQQSSANL